MEELGIEATFHDKLGEQPLFITITDTVGATDVGPLGCIERNDHSADLGCLRWLALKRAFF